jgi:hypothetical protein
MPKKIQNITRGTLEAVPLPVHAATYTVISHKSIMDYALAEITAKGFTIFSEEYRSTHDGQIAQGIYQLTYNSDPEMSLMFAWTNSYNKQIRFKCAVGGYLRNNQTVMLGGEIGTYARKHTGTADADTIAMMQSQLTNATMYYDNLVADKEEMKLISLDTHAQAQLLGVLFAQYEIINTEQASIIRQQMSKPSFFHNGGKDTLWSFYNHVTLALQQSHPRTWMEDQRILHWVITNEFDLSKPAPIVNAPIEVTELLIDPLTTNYGEPENQTNLLVQIAEETGDDSVLKAQYPVLEKDAFEIHIESDQEYLERVVEIEGEPEIIDLDAEEDEEWETLEAAGIITPCAAHDVETELVQYTDPAGNTFELPMLKESEIPVVKTKVPQEFIDAFMNAPEIDASEIDMSKVTWINVPEVAPNRVKFAIDETEEESPVTIEEKIEEALVPTPLEKEDDDFDITFDLDNDTINTDHDEFF